MCARQLSNAEEDTIALARRVGWTMNILDWCFWSSVGSSKANSHAHVLSHFGQKKNKNHIFSYYSFKALSTKLEVVNKEAAFLFASLCACAHLAVSPLAPLSASQRSALLQLLVANNMEKGTCPEVWGTKFGF